MLLLLAITLGLVFSDNGMIEKAGKANYNVAVSELYDRTYVEMSYLVIPDRIARKNDFSFEKLYSSPGFTEFYEIRTDNYIYDKKRNLKLIPKEDLEKEIREKFKSEGKESAKPLVNPVTNEDTKISGSGEPYADIYIVIGGTEYKTKVRRKRIMGKGDSCANTWNDNYSKPKRRR